MLNTTGVRNCLRDLGVLKKWRFFGSDMRTCDEATHLRMHQQETFHPKDESCKIVASCQVSERGKAAKPRPVF